MINRSDTLAIRTPEGITFNLVLAGPISRFLAWLVDFGVIMVLSSIIAQIVSILNIISPDLARAVVILVYFIVAIGYGVLMEYRFRGQTLGKRLLRLQVMDEQGLPLTFSQVVIRNLLRFVDSLPALYLVGGLTCFLGQRAQRLGDLAAGTIVIRHPETRTPDLDQILSGQFNSFSQYPHLEARLRQRVTPREAGIAVQALLRRDRFDPEARLQLFHELGDHFRSKVQFPAEMAESLSDEQYVRNVAAAVFQKRRS